MITMTERLSAIVNGKTETGKSYLVKNEIIPNLAKQAPVIVFDRKAEYAGVYAKDVPETWQKHNGIFAFFNTLEGENQGLSGVNVIKCTKDDDYIYGLTFVRELADRYHKSPAVVLDEAHDIFLVREFYSAKKATVQLSRYGSHANIDLVFISQRTLDLPKDFRTQFDTVISFYQGDRGSISAIQEITSCDIDKAEKITKLNDREFITFGKVPYKVKSLKNNSYD